MALKLCNLMVLLPSIFIVYSSSSYSPPPSSSSLPTTSGGTDKIVLKNEETSSSSPVIMNKTTIDDNKESRETLSTFIYNKLHCLSPSSSVGCESKFIRTKHGDSCLDSGCCKYFSNSLALQKNGDNYCPPRPWLKWYFIDQYLVSDNPELKIVAAPWEKSNLFSKTAVCLDCWNGMRECEIRTTVCWGPIQQQWRVEMFSGQIDNVDKKVFFSIMSEGLNKDNCVHIIDANYTAGMGHQPTFNNSMGPKTICEEPGICLQLSRDKCTGSYWESFYLEQVKWEDYLQALDKNHSAAQMAADFSSSSSSSTETLGGQAKSALFYIEITLGGLVLTGLGVALILLWRKLTSAQKTLQSFYLLTNEEVDEFLYGNPSRINCSMSAHENAIYMPFDRKYEINEEDLAVDKDLILGKGQFGIVTRGHLKDHGPVAVKTTHPHVDVSYFKALLVEIKVMSFVGKQENIVEFLGCVTTKIEQREAYLIVELSPLGDLQSFLIRQRASFVMAMSMSMVHDCQVVQKNNYVTLPQATVNSKIITAKDLTYFALQIVKGLEFLSSKKVIHGDLACRNILVFDNNVVKISDFGLARKLYTYGKYKKKKPDYLPWRWLAVESLRDLEFSTYSDIWSVGVTAWEIWTLAETPYHGLSYSLDFVDLIQQGLRLQKPKYASQTIFEEIILPCWSLVPQDRPSASQIKERLEDILSQF